jgi:hypothetical protein
MFYFSARGPAKFHATYAWVIGNQAAASLLYSAGVSSQEAYRIDSKIDDGNGSTGNVQSSYGWPYNACADSNGVYYNSDVFYYPGVGGGNSTGCAMFFVASF